MPGVQPATQVPGITTNSTNLIVRSNGTNADHVFTAEQVEAIRQQEKDKVYSRLESERQKREEMEARLRVFEEEREARLKAEDDARKAAEEAERKRIENETDLRTLLEQREAELRAQIEAERQERERALALLEKEREFAALEAYRMQQIRQYEDQILPELQDEVSGNTQAEVDASIARLVAKTQSILENVGAVAAAQRQAQPGTRVTAPPVGPLESHTEQQTLTSEDILAMPMNEYAKRRGQFGVTGGSTHRGLFG